LKKKLLVAVGGNSLIRAGEKGTVPEQFANARVTSEGIADLVADGYDVVVTHGNGPQVGAQLLRSEAGSTQTYAMPLDVCVATTQGEIGYILQTSLQSALKDRNICIPVVAMTTQVLVDARDEAFRHPTKPIGPFYSRDGAERKRAEEGWEIIEDASRGYRRVVASPMPLSIIELEAIRTCLEQGMLVIAAGGGGIPVVIRDGELRGVEAVIDKDRASALLASQLKIPRFLISTDVEQIFLNYKQPTQTALRRMSLMTARRYCADGQFHVGSMLPKVEAAIAFLEAGGEEVIITDPAHLRAALEGSHAGTHITAKEVYETVPRH